MKQLKGKNVLVTGGSRGLGPLIAHALAARGANVAVAARSREPLEQVSREISDRHRVAGVAVAADLGTAEGREQAVAATRAALGSIDVLVNNAGIEWVASYPEIEPATIEQIVTTNLLAPMLLTRLVLPEMLARGSGQIVNISSMAGKKGPPYAATYAATKAGINEWSGALRAELRGTGVGVSLVSPGFVAETGMFAVYRRRAPWIAGESKPDKVAAAVVRAIARDRAEIVVNPGPVRLMVVVNALSPRLMTWLYRKGGVHRFYREQAELNARQLEDQAPRAPGDGGDSELDRG